MTMRTYTIILYCRIALAFTFGTFIYWLTTGKRHYRGKVEHEVLEMGFHIGPNGEPSKHQDSVREMMIESTQLKRRGLLQKHCHVRTRDKIKLSLYTKKHIYVEDSHRLMYCVIPKVGCSNWKRVLMVLHARENVDVGQTSGEVHTHVNNIPVLSNFNSKQQFEKLSNYTRFFFVRHPFSRLLSVYRNNFENTKQYRGNKDLQRYGKHIIKEWRENPTQRDLQTGEGVTWIEFVDYLIHVTERELFEKDDYVNDHWREMHKICSPCSIEYDFIGKLEDVVDESKYILERLKVSDEVKCVSSTNSHPTNSSSEATYHKYFSMLDQKQTLGLWQIYLIDFLLFGYDKPDFVP